MVHRSVSAGGVLFSLLAKTLLPHISTVRVARRCDETRESARKFGHCLAVDCANLGALRDIRLFWLGASLCRDQSRGLDRVAVECVPAFNSAALRVGPELPALTFVLLGMLAAWRASEANGRNLVWWTGAGLLFGAASWFAYAAVAILPGVSCIALYKPEAPPSAADFYGVLVLLGIPALCLAPSAPLECGAGLDSDCRRNVPDDLGIRLDEFSSARCLLAVEFFATSAPRDSFRVVLAFLDWRRRATREARFIFWCGLPGVLLGIYFVLRGGSGILYFLLVAPLLLLKAMDLFASRPASCRGLALVGGHPRWHFFTSRNPSMRCKPVAVGGMRRLRWAASSLKGLRKARMISFLSPRMRKLASVLGYYLRNDFVAPAGHPTVYVRESQDISNQFAFWPSYADFTETGRVTDEYFTEQQAENAFLGRSALYITHERAGDLPQSIKAAFDSVILFRELPGAGDDSRPLYFYLCLIYQTLPL